MTQRASNPFQFRLPKSLAYSAAGMLITLCIAHADDIAFTKPLDAFSAFNTRPLFSASRKSVEVVPEIVAPPQSNTAPPLNAILLGLISTGDGTGLALLRLEGQPQPVRVHVGETVSGWQLEAVESHQAVFSFGEEKSVLQFPKAAAENVPVASEPAADTTGNVPLMPDGIINP